MRERKHQVAYIAGKITGVDEYWEKFQEAADKLEALGYIVLNHAMLPSGLTPADYMKICFPMIYAADIVFFLPGWEDSKGATLEMEFCKYIGKPFSILEVPKP